jgi:maltooligosyltrehalose trehalohydrolase
MHRGSLAIACNLGTEAVDVPVAGEFVLAWGNPTVDAGTTRLEGHSFVIVKSPSTG